ncbi:hypothetical protein EDD37DRAFT_169570 [Exophiala viscosa]|uniref:uncharacterized protein n=1 Tax=Exophiala viscosa TaxID=2486360 RepID=UPI00219D7115|nr:hypothetical protein EDD37DRAFT_169570 [Exophiala viscosa]
MMNTPTRPVLGPVSSNLTSTQHKLLYMQEPSIHDDGKPGMLAQLEKQAQGYMDNVLENFRKANASLFADTQAQAEAKAQKHLTKAIANHSAALTQGEVETKSDSGIIPFPDFVDSPISAGGMKLLDEDKTIQHGEFLPSAGENRPAANPPSASEAVVKGELRENNLHLTTTMTDSGSVPFGQANSPTIVVTASTDTDKSIGSDGSNKGTNLSQEEQIEDNSEDQQDEESDEDREHRTHFKSWGAPGIRNKQSKSTPSRGNSVLMLPESRIRTVILLGLPSTADLTLVHSLVHGGTIEVIRLTPASPESSTVNAHVTFTNGDACYLDCGATRVLKVTGADDDWGIVALNRFAEGKNKTRAIEAVTDTYRNGERIIHFRFANITDAVRFKGILIRSFEWEGCPVEFAEDPCSRATGVHYD